MANHPLQTRLQVVHLSRSRAPSFASGFQIGCHALPVVRPRERHATEPMDGISQHPVGGCCVSVGQPCPGVQAVAVPCGPRWPGRNCRIERLFPGRTFGKPWSIEKTAPSCRCWCDNPCRSTLHWQAQPLTALPQFGAPPNAVAEAASPISATKRRAPRPSGRSCGAGGTRPPAIPSRRVHVRCW